MLSHQLALVTCLSKLQLVLACDVSMYVTFVACCLCLRRHLVEASVVILHRWVRGLHLHASGIWWSSHWVVRVLQIFFDHLYLRKHVPWAIILLATICRRVRLVTLVRSRLSLVEALWLLELVAVDKVVDYRPTRLSLTHVMHIGSGSNLAVRLALQRSCLVNMWCLQVSVPTQMRLLQVDCLPACVALRTMQRLSSMWVTV